MLLLVPVILFSGCATLSTSQMVETTKTRGVEHIFNHPYKKVFYACEDSLEKKSHGQWGHWEIEESDIKNGVIKGRHLGREMIIIVERTAKNKILVKMQKFGVVAGYYERFFKNVERLARRD